MLNTFKYIGSSIFGSEKRIAKCCCITAILRALHDSWRHCNRTDSYTADK